MPIDETVESFEALVNGDLDNVPEQAFLNVGGVESVLEKATDARGRGGLVADGVFGVEIVTPEQSLFAGGATLGRAGHLRRGPDGPRRPHAAGGRRGALRGQGRAARRGRCCAWPCTAGSSRSTPARARPTGLAEGDGPLPGLSTRVTVLAGVAELAEEIDVPRAEQAREAATPAGRATSGAGRAPGRRGRRRGRASSPRPRAPWPGPSCGSPWPPTAPR